jgi:hypothetical protein
MRMRERRAPGLTTGMLGSPSLASGTGWHNHIMQSRGKVGLEVDDDDDGDASK